jgi:hypothetical protein
MSPISAPDAFVNDMERHDLRHALMVVQRLIIEETEELLVSRRVEEALSLLENSIILSK